MVLSINMVLTFTSTWTLWHCISDWVCVRILKTMCSIVLCSSNIIRARSSSTWLTNIIIIHKLIMSILMYIKHIKSRWPIYLNLTWLNYAPDSFSLLADFFRKAERFWDRCHRTASSLRKLSRHFEWSTVHFFY